MEMAKMFNPLFLKYLETTDFNTGLDEFLEKIKASPAPDEEGGSWLNNDKEDYTKVANNPYLKEDISFDD